MGCVRTCMIFINVIVWIIGIAVLAVGIWAAVDQRFKDTLCPARNEHDTEDTAKAKEQACKVASYILPGSIALIIVGAIIFLVGFCGCFGALKSSHCLLTIYAAVLVIMLLALLAAAVLVFLQYIYGWYTTIPNEKGSLQKLFENVFDTEIEEYSKKMDEKTLVIVGPLQKLFKCCGNNGSADYVIRGIPVPNSCKPAGRSEETSSKIFTNGCTETILSKLQEYGKKAGVAAIVFAVFLLIGIICSCCMCRTVSDEFKAV